jgi:hypothetical protein
VHGGVFLKGDVMKSFLRGALGAIVALTIVLGAYYLWQKRQGPQRQTPVEPPVAAASEPPAAQAPKRPAIENPIEQVAAAASVPAAAASAAALPPPESQDSYVANALVDLLGSREAQTFLSLDGFVRHLVTTVDNLPRKQAAVRLWPVQPAPGRMVTEVRDDGSYISSGNAARYEPFVSFVESVNTAKAVALYVRLYPLFQKAYQDLGYPDGYFNDRLIAVIDHLLQTPDLPRLPKVTLPEVKGPIPPPRPWVMYEFEDLALDELSAGQKILLRMGPAHTKRLKAKLADLRKRVARSGVRQ